MSAVTLQEARSNEELLANLIREKSKCILESHFASVKNSIRTIETILIFRELANPMGGRLKARINYLVERGHSAYEMDLFRHTLLRKKWILREDIAKLFGVDASTVSKWFSDCTIGYFKRKRLLEKYESKCIPLENEENFVYALAWASSKFRREILNKIPKHEQKPDSPQEKLLPPHNCVYLRCALENTNWCRGITKNNSKILQTAINEINIAAQKTYRRLLANPRNKTALMKPVTIDEMICITKEWEDTFELIAYCLSPYIYDYRARSTTFS